MEKLNTGQAAAFLGVPPSVLKRARDHGIGPQVEFTLGYGYLYPKDQLELYADRLHDLVPTGATTRRELRPHPRGTDEWCNPLTGEFYKISRSTDPRYKKALGGGYVLKD